MTQGNILGHIIRFALPLLLGNLFQQLYNMVDSWVVGNYVSNEAYSAVGSVGWISSCLISFFTGLATGAGVVIGQYYGAGQKDKVQQAVHTAIAMTLGLGVIFTGLGLVSIPFMLDVLNKKPVRLLFPIGMGFCLKLCYADKAANRGLLCFGIAFTALFCLYMLMMFW